MINFGYRVRVYRVFHLGEKVENLKDEFLVLFISNVNLFKYRVSLNNVLGH